MSLHFSFLRINRLAAAVIAILVLLAAVGLAAEEKKKTEPKKKPTKEELERQLLNYYLDQIHQYQSQTPPGYQQMADVYLLIFQRFPSTQQGKMAGWEAYELYRKTQDYTKATATLTSIMSVYGFEDTMDNPLDAAKPIAMRATARLELAKLYADRGDLLSAAAIARTVPNQFPGVFVGRFSGDDSYYGPVESVCLLESARFSILSGQTNQAMILLLDLIRTHPGERIGAMSITLDLDYHAVRLAHKAIMEMPASESKRIAMYEELHDACRGKLAQGKIRFYRAELWLKTYRELANLQRIEDALAEYRAVLADHPDVIEPAGDADMLLSVAAIRQIRKLMIAEAKDPKRALYELSRIEKEYESAKTPEAKTIAAYARYYNAMVSYQNMKNYRQAIYDLEILLEKYPGVLEYPSPRGETTKFMLEQHVKKMIREIREKNG